MNAKEIVKTLSLREKAYFVSGMTFWKTQPIEQYDIASMLLIDGPHGLRKQVDKSDHLGVNEAQNAICFPPACALAASFDTDLLEKVGSYIGEEAAAENVAIVLGPANNIKRSPLCGRNFEYFSEDPYLAGKLAAAHIRGLQKHGVGTSLKHFAVNNQERWRNTINAVVDERTLREIYLCAFEIPVRESQPMSVMCSYNRVNGTYLAENSYILNDILRGEWGFEGFVVSDWGAVDELHKSIAAGLDLEMPTSGKIGPEKIIRQITKGTLSIEQLDTAVERLINAFLKITANRKSVTPGPYDKEAHHRFAYEAAKECVVLLKNEGGILPLDNSSRQKIAVIGDFAQNPRFQGGGSSHINPYKVETLLDSIKTLAGNSTVLFARGYCEGGDCFNDVLLEEARNIAKDSDIVIISAGLTDEYETEASDRLHLNMPPEQLALIDAVCAVNDRVVIILSNGSPVKMPFEPKVKAIVEGYLLGQAGAKAMADILFGKHNPSGKLAESFLKDEKDDPAFGNMPGDKGEVVYKEGLYVGYRYHDKFSTDLLYPFGYGLSYTSYEYSNIHCDRKTWNDNETVVISVDIANTGDMAGKEIVQLYVGEKSPCVDRPVKELKAFEKIQIAAGEKKTIRFELNKRSFAFYHVDQKQWIVNPGDYVISIGKSSKEICQVLTVSIESSQRVNPPKVELVFRNALPTDRSGRISRNTRVEELADHPVGKFIYRKALHHAEMMFGDASFSKKNKPEEANGNSENGASDFKLTAVKAMILESPLRNMVNMSAGAQMKESGLTKLIGFLNLTRRDRILGKILHFFLK